MAQFIQFDEFGLHIGNGTTDLDTHSFRAILTNTAPVKATSLVLADITQIANANGYVTNGVALSSVTYTETGAGTGIWQWSCADFSWTAAGGSIGPFRYVVFYNDTPTSPADPLVGFIDYGTNLTITDGNTFLVDVGASGVTRLTV